MRFGKTVSELSVYEVVNDIVEKHEYIESEWQQCGGWAPADAARLVAGARLDWLTSLARSLSLWTEYEIPKNQCDGQLILAWTNLGALLEGSMKFLLSIWVQNYNDAIDTKSTPLFKNFRDRKTQLPIDPDGITLNKLREFFREEIWVEHGDAQHDNTDWNEWVMHIGRRRNAVHAYKDRELGTFDEFSKDVRTYLRFLDEQIVGRLPEPPNHSMYC